MNIYRVYTMSKLSSYLEQINNASIEISQKTSIKKKRIMYDIMKCSIKYSASPNNYKKFKFYELDDEKMKEVQEKIAEIKLAAKEEYEALA